MQDNILAQLGGVPSFSPRWLHNGYCEAFELVKGNGGRESVAHKLKVLDSDDEGLDVDEEAAESEAKEPDSKRLRFEGQMSVAANPAAERQRLKRLKDLMPTEPKKRLVIEKTFAERFLHSKWRPWRCSKSERGVMRWRPRWQGCAPRRRAGSTRNEGRFPQ